jgi:hypothetical protein
MCPLYVRPKRTIYKAIKTKAPTRIMFAPAAALDQDPHQDMSRELSQHQHLH